MPFLHMHDGEAIVYDDVCPVCVVPQQIEALEEVKTDG